MFTSCFRGIILKICNHINLGSVFAIRLLKIIMLTLSAFSMYLTAKIIYKDKRKAMFSSLFYLSSSYFYVDIFTRDALNESALFIFIPLVFLSFYYLFKENNRKLFIIYFIIGYVGMIYSHLVMSVFFTILLIPFLLLFYKKIFNKSNFKALLIASISILILTSTFTVPLIEHMIANKWNLPFKAAISIPLSVYLKEELYKTGSNNLIYINLLNIVIILNLIASYKTFKDKKDKNRKYMIGLFLFILVSIIFSGTNIFWKNAPDFFKTIQFTWRLATYVVVGTSLFAVNGLDYLFSIFKSKYVWICSVTMIILTFNFAYSHYTHASFFNDIGHTDYGYKTDLWNDYLPVNTMNNYEYFKSRKNNKIIGEATTNILKNNTPYLKFEVKDADKEVELELPRLYYLGYTITDNEGNKIDYKENKYGLLSIKADNGIYTVKYTGTLLYRITVCIKSFLIFILLCLLVIKLIKSNKKVLS